jgi:hypothetical protein
MFGAVAPAVKGMGTDDNVQKVSPYKERLDALIKGAELGQLAFLSVDNNDGLSIVPSRRNFAGGIRFKGAVVDSACATHLIRIDNNDMLDAILTQFSDRDVYTLVPRTLTGSSGESLTLSVKYLRSKRRFTVLIGSDLFGDANSVEVPKLRFQLSSDSAQFILSKGEYTALFADEELELLGHYQHKAVPSIPVSLVGNEITNNFSELRNNSVRYFFDPQQCLDIRRLSIEIRLSTEIRVIRRLSIEIRQGLALPLQEFGVRDYEFDEMSGGVDSNHGFLKS